jgi:MtN3 and saliva related transmembrane protein
MSELTTIVGFMAGFVTTAANLPQVWKTYRTKSGEGLSFRTLLGLAIGVGLWIVYGIMNRLLPLIVTNAVVLLLILCGLFVVGSSDVLVVATTRESMLCAQSGWTIRKRFPSGSRKKNCDGTGSGTMALTETRPDLRFPVRAISASTSTPLARRVAWSASMSSVANAQ